MIFFYWNIVFLSRYHVSETPLTYYNSAAPPSYYSAPSYYTATASYQSSIPTYSTAYGFYEEPVYYITTNAYHSPMNYYTYEEPRHYSTGVAASASLSSYSSSTTAPFYYVELKSGYSAPSVSYIT